ncbi:hypothetical protein [Latilactobacillus sakei]|uniref:Uncharacterized protein n=1 Tax=Latilactobacillus sakei TaxID=1599 RepID=A0AAF0GNJ2_LATSK|nr:hypothetical protein [Latilactobacillus sakei]MDH0601656.1 hypothetical protein [Latilactobacillus sakei]WGI19615.1 hypothetical protein QBD03_02565 [Latilactobacillus sakei]
MFQKFLTYATRSTLTKNYEIDYLISLLLSDDFILNTENFNTLIHSATLKPFISKYDITIIKYNGKNIGYEAYENIGKKINQLSSGQQSILILRIKAMKNNEDTAPLLNKTYKEYFALIPILLTFLISGTSNYIKESFALTFVGIIISSFVCYFLLNLIYTGKENKYELKYDLLESLFN